MWVKKPYKENFKITSVFGRRKNPITGKSEFHPAIDIAMPVGTDLFAIITGEVKNRIYRKGINKGYGRYVTLEGLSGINRIRFKFAHLSAYGQPKSGHAVEGVLIAKSGSSGASTGPHLHLEFAVFKNSRWVPENPVAHIDFSRSISNGR